MALMANGLRAVTPHMWASLGIYLISFTLVALGLQALLTPEPAYHAHSHESGWHYEGPLLICIAIISMLYTRYLAHKIIWAFEEIHRWISALLVAGALGVDAAMHVLNIPHMEGWWMPLLSGGVLATAMTAWLRKPEKSASES